MDNLMELSNSAFATSAAAVPNKVVEILKMLIRATKSRTIYPSSSKLPQQFSDELYGYLCQILNETESLCFNVTADTIHYGDIEIYRAQNKSDNFALPFFRDGVKSFEFDRGLEFEELSRFVEIVSKNIQGKYAEEDIATLFWESDFSHIRYELMDDFLNIDSFEYGLASLNASGLPTESDIQKYYSDRSALTNVSENPDASSKNQRGQKETEAAGGLDIKNEFIRNLKVFNEEDSSTIAKLISDDDSINANENIIRLIFEILILETDRAGRHEALELIGKVHDDLIKFCDFLSAGIIIGRLKEFTGIISSFGNQDHDVVQEYLETLAVPERIRLIINSLNHEIDIEHTDVVEYLEMLPKQVIPLLVGALGDLVHFSGRRAVCKALVTLAADDIDLLAKGIEDSRWFVVRNTVMIMGEINNQKVLKYFRKTIHHPEPRVRKETLAAAVRMKCDEVCDFLIKGLSEKDEKLLSMALEELVRRKAAKAYVAIERIVCNKNFKNRPDEQSREFLTAMAKLGGQKSFRYLKKLARQISFFSSEKKRSLRLNAVRALGYINFDGSICLLEKMAKSRNHDLANTAKHSLNMIVKGAQVG